MSLICICPFSFIVLNLTSVVVGRIYLSRFICFWLYPYFFIPLRFIV